MITQYGTSHFEDWMAAVRYYKPYENNNLQQSYKAVERKIKEGVIHIGPPEVKPGESISLNEEEGRYFITVNR